LALAMALVLAVNGGTPASAQTRVKAKIRLDWKGGAQHAPFYLGKQRGYYREEGLDLDVISGTGSSDTIKQVGCKAVELMRSVSSMAALGPPEMSVPRPTRSPFASAVFSGNTALLK
jgi:NitT/TauT family transport system substrate-binding protein